MRHVIVQKHELERVRMPYEPSENLMEAIQELADRLAAIEPTVQFRMAATDRDVAITCSFTRRGTPFRDIIQAHVWEENGKPVGSIVGGN